MNSSPPTIPSHTVFSPADEADDSRLDEAMQKGDQLLLDSLRAHDRRRHIRNFSIIAGGFIAITTFAALTTFVLQPAIPQANTTTNPSIDANALSRQGWVLWQAGEYKAAADQFQSAVKTDPKHVNAWNGLGWSQFDSGNPDGAKEAFEKCLALSPKHPAALNGMGQLNYAAGKLDEAEKYLKPAAELNATAAWWGLTKVYLLQGKFDDAATWAKKIVDAGDTSAQPLLDAAKNKNLPDSLRALISPTTQPAL